MRHIDDYDCEPVLALRAVHTCKSPPAPTHTIPSNLGGQMRSIQIVAGFKGEGQGGGILTGFGGKVGRIFYLGGME